uniref:Uncharacterized protein n=1 Tax=Oryzias latipes TaxID=8090 RepID=A0A3B3IMG1_ORYLA
MFMPQAHDEDDEDDKERKVQARNKDDKEWRHEDASVEMFQYLLEKNRELLTEMKNSRLEDNDLVFIKELILGEPLKKKSDKPEDPSDWPYEGRGEDKSFLYEIVSNKQNGIDVDKFDYFARDCHHLGLKNNFDHMRYFKFTRVIGVEKNKLKRKHICSRDKEAGNLYDLFYTRDRLHRRAYQHKVTKNVEIMIKDALLKANKHIKFKGKDKEKKENFFTISDAKDNMEAYTQLTDQVTQRILESSSSELEQARNILERIKTRDLYELVDEAKGQNKQHKKISKETITNELKVVLPGEVRDHHNDYFEVVLVTYSYGKGDKDPVECSYFYKKDGEPPEAFQITRQQVSNFLPECFWEQTIRLYWKNKDKTHWHDVAEKFTVWCEHNRFQVIFRPAMLKVKCFKGIRLKI